MNRIGRFVFVALMASGLVANSPPAAGGPPAQSSQIIQPSEAIYLAAGAPSVGVSGVFEMRVQATGVQGQITYLNSELDYRDQRNLTVAIAPAAASQLTARLGGHPRSTLKNKRIRVEGVARRVKIVFYSDGKPSDKYYYQTHVRIRHADQISVW